MTYGNLEKKGYVAFQLRNVYTKVSFDQSGELYVEMGGVTICQIYVEAMLISKMYFSSFFEEGK